MDETDSSDLPIYLDRSAFNPPGTDQIGPENWDIKLDDHLDLLDSSDSEHMPWIPEVYHPLQSCLFSCFDKTDLEGLVLTDFL